MGEVQRSGVHGGRGIHGIHTTSSIGDIALYLKLSNYIFSFQNIDSFFKSLLLIYCSHGG